MMEWYQLNSVFEALCFKTTCLEMHEAVHDILNHADLYSVSSQAQELLGEW